METMPQTLMMLGNPWQLGLVLLVVILLFGKGKVSDLMGDFAKGIKAFKKGMSDDEPAPTAAKPLDHQQARSEAPTPANTETGTRV
jgi:sec-independent protein translocase protein TatA